MSSSVIRTVGLVPVAVCVFAVSMRSVALGSETPPAPPAKNEPATVHDTGAPPAPGSSTPALAPASQPQAAATAKGTDRADCARYIDALSGGKEATVLGKPEVQALALRVPDLLSCAAVEGDSPRPCEPLVGKSSSGQPLYSENAKHCLYMQSMFHEARTYPKSHSFLLTDLDVQQCRDHKECEVLRDALRKGDEKHCDQVSGDAQRVCRAYLKLDKSLCRAPGAGTKSAREVEAYCVKIIDTRSFLGKGLKALAESGSTREATLAKAALGQAGACDGYAKAAMDACLAAAPTGTAPVSGTPSPAGTSKPRTQP